MSQWAKKHVSRHRDAAAAVSAATADAVVVASLDTNMTDLRGDWSL